MTDVTKASQVREIVEYMAAGNKIDPIKALNMFGCLRLAARIADIQRHGYPVQSRMVVKVHPNGSAKKYKEYWFDEVRECKD